MTQSKRIILEDGKLPHFEGAWTVGEVLQIAQQLAQWVEQLQIPAPKPPPPKQNEANE